MWQTAGEGGKEMAPLQNTACLRLSELHVFILWSVIGDTAWENGRREVK